MAHERLEREVEDRKERYLQISTYAVVTIDIFSILTYSLWFLHSIKFINNFKISTLFIDISLNIIDVLKLS